MNNKLALITGLILYYVIHIIMNIFPSLLHSNYIPILWLAGGAFDKVKNLSHIYGCEGVLRTDGI